MASDLDLPPASDPAKAAVREYGSAEEYALSQGLGTPRLNGSVPAGFRAKVARMDLGGVRIRSGEASMPLTTVGAVGHSHSFVFATRPSAPRMLSGREIAYGTLFHPRPNDLLTGVSPSGQPWPFATITVSYRLLEDAGAAVVGHRVAPSRLDLALICTLPRTGDHLRELVADASRLAATRPEVAEHPGTARALAGAILDSLVFCLAQGELHIDRSAMRRRSRIMAKLEALLSDNPDEIYTLAGLCAALGVSARSLQLICHEFAGVGVIQYVRAHRLAAVRRVLSQSDPRQTRVADVAMRYGFWELGRFSGAYRSLFGEQPSATLRRVA